MVASWSHWSQRWSSPHHRSNHRGQGSWHSDSYSALEVRLGRYIFYIRSTYRHQDRYFPLCCIIRIKLFFKKEPQNWIWFRLLSWYNSANFAIRQTADIFVYPPILNTTRWLEADLVLHWESSRIEIYEIYIYSTQTLLKNIIRIRVKITICPTFMWIG